MPFTFSHPAAVLPLRRFRLPLLALVVGSMAPDFPYFLELAPGDGAWHRLPGALTSAVLAGVVVVLLVEHVLREPVLALLPRSHEEQVRALLKRASHGQLRGAVMVVIALVIGIITHVLWDSVTHSTGFGVRRIGFLSASVGHFAGRDIHLFKLLQHASSVFGAILLIANYCTWVRRGSEKLFYDRRDWKRAAVLMLLMVVPLLVALAYGWRAVGMLSADYGPSEAWIGRVIVSDISFTFAAIVFYSLAWHVSTKLRAFTTD